MEGVGIPGESRVREVVKSFGKPLLWCNLVSSRSCGGVCSLDLETPMLNFSRGSIEKINGCVYRMYM